MSCDRCLKPKIKNTFFEVHDNLRFVNPDGNDANDFLYYSSVTFGSKEKGALCVIEVTEHAGELNIKTDEQGEFVKPIVDSDNAKSVTFTLSGHHESEVHSGRFSEIHIRNMTSDSMKVYEVLDEEPLEEHALYLEAEFKPETMDKTKQNGPRFMLTSDFQESPYASYAPTQCPYETVIDGEVYTVRFTPMNAYTKRGQKNPSDTCKAEIDLVIGGILYKEVSFDLCIEYTRDDGKTYNELLTLIIKLSSYCQDYF